MRRFEWREGSRISLDPQIVGEHFEQLEQHAPLTAEAVLEDAKDKNSPTHDHFEWNNAKAAHEYRLEQARGLIREVVVIVEHTSTVQKDPIRVRAFTHVKTDERRYVTTATAMSSDALRREVLHEAYKELKSFRQKYKTLKELAAVLDAIDQLTLELAKV